jgi:hypothetical protein
MFDEFSWVKRGRIVRLLTMKPFAVSSLKFNLGAGFLGRAGEAKYMDFSMVVGIDNRAAGLHVTLHSFDQTISHSRVVEKSGGAMVCPDSKEHRCK